MAEANVTVTLRLTIVCFCGAAFQVDKGGVDLLRDHLVEDHGFPLGDDTSTDRDG